MIMRYIYILIGHKQILHILNKDVSGVFFYYHFSPSYNEGKNMSRTQRILHYFKKLHRVKQFSSVVIYACLKVN